MQESGLHNRYHVSVSWFKCSAPLGQSETFRFQKTDLPKSGSHQRCHVRVLIHDEKRSWQLAWGSSLLIPVFSPFMHIHMGS